MAQNNSDEIDLGVIFQKIKEAHQNFLVFLFNCVQFVFKYWIILLILIVGGAAGGYFWQKSVKAQKLATLIVQPNFESTSYVYDAIELLQIKQKQGDKKFLSEYGFNTEEAEIIEITIEPIVNIMDLLEKTETNDRNLEQYLDQSDFEEEVLLSEVFFTEYKYHKIYVTTTSIGNDETIQKTLDYLNNNELLQEVKKATITQINRTIKAHELSIEEIDGVIKNYTEFSIPSPGSSDVYYYNNVNNSIPNLLEQKGLIIEETKNLRLDILKLNDIVTLINKPRIRYIYSLKDQKTTLIPLALVFVFVLFSILRNTYYKAKRIAEKKQS